MFPEFFDDMLLKSYGEELKEKISNGYQNRKKVTFRVNTLKTSKEKIKIKLENKGIKFREIEWNKDAIVLEDAEESEIKNLEMYENGEIYLQNLSSMLPPIVLEPKSNENILDMAAAPGGKTTELTVLSNNQAMITACEKNKIRAERLKYNLNKQGATRVNVIVQDARKLDDFLKFDKILLDSPCSGSGTLDIHSKEFTKELIERMIKIQEELLKKATRIIKSGGEIVYSTCSILRQENEEIINNILKDGKFEIIPIKNEFVKNIPTLPTLINGTICIMPNDIYEGFFVAKIRKK